MFPAEFEAGEWTAEAVRLLLAWNPAQDRKLHFILHRAYQTYVRSDRPSVLGHT